MIRAKKTNTIWTEDIQDTNTMEVLSTESSKTPTVQDQELLPGNININSTRSRAVSGK